ncbi:MAG: hypothetical protein EA397_12475 [Deltaproteobacteria bacterium]|nr:MAG: hypothetical protein EA397_12475 [Deltaproteobacteria bacterium]
MTHFNALHLSAPATDLATSALLADLVRCSSATSHRGLARITSTLGGDSFALFNAGQGGRFERVLCSSATHLERAVAAKVDDKLLLRRLASSQAPVLLTPELGGQVGRSLHAHGIRWVVGLPVGDARGVLVIVGRETQAPSAVDLHSLRDLAASLVTSLGRRTRPAPMVDPMSALRQASARQARRRRWSALASVITRRVS